MPHLVNLPLPECKTIESFKGARSRLFNEWREQLPSIGAYQSSASETKAVVFREILPSSRELLFVVAAPYGVLTLAQPRPAKKKKSGGDSANPLSITSGEESDRLGALRAVEVAEEKTRKSGKRGPQNQSLKHWHDPVAVNDRKLGARWEFKCRYCKA